MRLRVRIRIAIETRFTTWDRVSGLGYGPRVVGFGLGLRFEFGRKR